MKAYTNIEQSKTLAEILPLESADAHYVRESTDLMGNPVDGKWSETKIGSPEKANYIVQNFTSYEILPCWSLAALLEVLPKYIGDYGKCLYYDMGYYYCGYMVDGDFMLSIEKTMADNPIDTIFEMIIKLNEMNLLL